MEDITNRSNISIDDMLNMSKMTDYSEFQTGASEGTNRQIMSDTSEINKYFLSGL